MSTQELLNNYKIGILTVMIKKDLLKRKFNNKFKIIGDFDYFIKTQESKMKREISLL